MFHSALCTCVSFRPEVPCDDVDGWNTVCAWTLEKTVALQQTLRRYLTLYSHLESSDTRRPLKGIPLYGHLLEKSELAPGGNLSYE